jgi:UDP-GlcNAc:undecaprenyl-phosphate GlcNAc-1-phosphate transferase
VTRIVLRVSDLTAFGISFLVALVLTPLIRSVATRSRFYAVPVEDRWHTRPIPLLGGAGILTAFYCGAFPSLTEPALMPLMIGVGLMFVLGLADDVKAIAPSTKLVGQMVVAGVVVALAPPISFTSWPVIDQLIAFAWIVAVTNAFNLLDNMDGLAAGIAVIAGVGYLALLGTTDSAALTLCIAAFVGAVMGFLRYNFPPASIFMGDGGSHFLGAFLACVSLLATPGMNGQFVPAAVFPILILLVPIFDTAFVTLTRRLAGRRATVGGRDHTSHRLVTLGASERVTVATFYTLAALGALLAVALQRLQIVSALGLIASYGLILGVIAVVLAHVSHPEARREGVDPPLLSEIAHRRRILEIAFDICLLTLAYYAAFRLRFPEGDASSFFPPFVRSVPLVVGAQIAGLYAAGKYRQVWRTLTTPELGTLVKGLAYGITAAVMLVVALYRLEGFSRGVFLLDGVIAFGLLVASRGATSSIDVYLRKRRATGKPAIIYGAGRGGALLVRELLQNREMGIVPIGYVDDDARKQNLAIEGLPVLGALDDLGTLVNRHQIAELLVAIRDLSPAEMEDLLKRCSQHGLTLRRMRFSVDEVRSVPTVLRREK